MVEIIQAGSAAEYAAARMLIEAYARWLGMDLEFQGFTQELATLDKVYGPPRGAMLLAREGMAHIGCVGLRPIDYTIAELKRMFVLPEHQGKGVGRMLMEAFIVKARSLGYRAIRLDTVPRLTVATALYRQYGFVEISAYRYNPHPDALFLELGL
jgi:putative acetyltransferase